jgi:ABC-2 type transport system ATP-binding protein/lipopolysaccharide transport system ATP-binding protein
MTAGSIRVQGVSKKFRLERNRPSSIKEAVLRHGKHSDADDFWVLRDINLDIPPGSFFGLIGHNGSGKSTLLRLMAGIHRPTTGTIESEGRLSALLELGSGFHPDLTGRENVYLNGAMLGLSRKQMAASMDQIIEFSGIGEFIDEPVKIYSSGMYVRLGFAVAVNVDPELLLVDEVIAVGDEEFQRRCMAHMNKLRAGGATIVLVSHNTNLMANLCDTLGWLDHGRLMMVGDPEEVIEAYLDHVNKGDNTLTTHD